MDSRRQPLPQRHEVRATPFSVLAHSHRDCSNPVVVENVQGEVDVLVAALRKSHFEVKSEPEIEAVQWVYNTHPPPLPRLSL